MRSKSGLLKSFGHFLNKILIFELIYSVIHNCQVKYMPIAKLAIQSGWTNSGTRLEFKVLSLKWLYPLSLSFSKFWVRNFFLSERNVGSERNFGSKKIKSLKKIGVPKKILGLEMFLDLIRKFWPRKLLGLKNNLSLEKNLVLNKFLVQKNFWVQKTFGPKFFWASSTKGCLPSKVVFHQRLSSFKGHFPLKVKKERGVV